VLNIPSLVPVSGVGVGEDTTVRKSGGDRRRRESEESCEREHFDSEVLSETECSVVEAPAPRQRFIRAALAYDCKMLQRPLSRLDGYFAD
jgi:hypothetical protein